jgi:ribose-phosphate pyrophosphokinase
VQPGAGEVLRFSEGNLFVRVKDNVRGRRVYLVQSTVFPPTTISWNCSSGLMR